MNPIPFDLRDHEFNEFVKQYYVKLENPLWYPDFINLNIGDCQVSEDICFEVKRINDKTHDLEASHRDGRLWDQTEQRVFGFRDGNVIIECPDLDKYFYTDYLTEAKWETIRKTLEWNYHQRLIFTKNYEETLGVILEAFHESIQSRSHAKPTNKAKKPKDLYDHQIYLLSSFADCSLEKSETLLAIFQTPLKVIKWIITAIIEKTKSGKPKGINPPIKGFGPEFITNNQKLLNTVAIKKEEK